MCKLISKVGATNAPNKDRMDYTSNPGSRASCRVSTVNNNNLSMKMNNMYYQWEKLPSLKVAGLFLILLGLFSCKSQDSIYEKYLVPNGLIYPESARDVVTKPGNGRIEISWRKGSDPKVTKARIFWNNYSDSVEVVIDPDKAVISRIINPIEEDTHSFMVHTYDEKGNISIPVEAMGTVYGKMYESSLTNRILKSATYNAGVLQLEWLKADPDEVGVILEYTDTGGNPKTEKVEKWEPSTDITDFNVSQPLFYSTMYKPVPEAIDTFYVHKAEWRLP